MALAIVFEVIFCFDIIISFMLSYDRQDTQVEIVEWNIQKTAYRYFTTNFLKDFLPVIPFQNLKLAKERNKLFYLFKMIRLIKGFKILDEHVIMAKIKVIWMKNVKEKILKDRTVANDKMKDHNGVEMLLLINYGIKITKLVIIILNFSYLFGMFWFIMIKLVEDFNGWNYKNPEDAAINSRTFIVYYDL